MEMKLKGKKVIFTINYNLVIYSAHNNDIDWFLKLLKIDIFQQKKLHTSTSAHNNDIY